MSRVLVLGCPLILSRLIETRLQLNVQTFPRRPPRVSWVRGTPVFFVTFCTYRRRSILATKNVHDSFVAFGLRAAQSHNIAVGRHVIMPDHIHLFVCGDLHFHLGKWIKALKQPLGKSISSGMRHDRICQEGFSIIFYAVTKAWCRNGNMCAIIPSAPDSLQFGRSGRFRGKLC